MSTDPDREMAGEVVRFEAVRHLQGPSAHAIGSLGFLCLGAGLWAIGWDELGFVAIAAAWLLSVNGLSLYGWDRLRLLIESRDRETGDDATDPETGEETTERTLAPPSLSTEHKAELLAGFVQVVTLVGIVGLTIVIVREFGVETAGYLLGGIIAAGNIGALSIVVYRSRRDET